MIPFEAACAIVAEQFATRRTAIETLPLDACLGRTLATALVAPNDVPGFAHSAMDGYAVAAADLRDEGATELPIAATIFAGATDVAPHRRGTAVRIMTGAPMPPGADAVVIKENTTVSGDRVTLSPGAPAGANVRLPDDDYPRGARAIEPGTRLGAADLAIAAAFGFSTLPVHARPRIAILVTGDELETPAGSPDRAPMPLQPGRRYDSNGPMLAALVREAGGEAVAVEHATDIPALIAQRLKALSQVADLVITSGGVSAGEADHLPAIVEREGRIHFWKVRMRPGMPALFGEIGDTPLFSLPGNPVSVFATFTVFVRPALDALVGVPPSAPTHARLASAIDKKHDRFELRRARLLSRDDGTLVAEPHPGLSSGALRSVVESDALIELEAVARRFEAGDVVRVRRLR